MRVDALRLRDFRNIEDALIEPHPRFNVLWGDNGQGKTNILEAVYLMGAVKSFRPQSNAHLIRIGTEAAMIEARIDRGGYDRVVRIDINPRGKKLSLNGNPVHKLADFFGTVNVVVFGPEDIQILKGSPADRRRFMDRAIFNAQPGYAVESQAYEDVLKHRNAVLKSERYDATLLSTYDDQLVTYGADVMLRRLEFLRDFRPVLSATFGAIFADELFADVRYDVRWSDEPLPENPNRDTLEALLARGLRDSADEARARGFTVVGPHRDDLAATLDGHEVKTYASQGQHRAFVLAMKIAEIRYLEERFHFAPILLLDDVSSELDRERNRFLFEFLRNRTEGQVFITTTHRDYILLDEDVQAYRVVAGAIETV